MRTWLGILSMILCGSTAIAGDAVLALSKYLGKTPALVVVVCGESAKDLPALAGIVDRTPWTVLCRGPVSPDLAKVRDWAREKGLLGKRMYVVDDHGSSLWLAGEMADAVWVMPDAKDPPSKEEVLRVLHPGGVYFTSEETVVKPFGNSASQMSDA